VPHHAEAQGKKGRMPGTTSWKTKGRVENFIFFPNASLEQRGNSKGCTSLFQEKSSHTNNGRKERSELGSEIIYFPVDGGKR